AAARIDRDRLMFLAGQASAMASGGCQATGKSDTSSNLMTGKLTHPARLAWPASTAALAATALTLAIMLWLRPDARTQIVYIERPASSPTTDTLTTHRQQALTTTPTAASSVRDVATTHVPADNYLRTREVALR